MQTADQKICAPKSTQIAFSIILLLVFSLSGCGQDYKVAMSRLSETDVVFPKQTVTKITRVPLIADSPIDILWLVDNSPGATAIQPAFTQGINSFAKKYLSPGAESLLNKDLRIAAIPTDLYLAGSTACLAREDLVNDLLNNQDFPGWSVNPLNRKVLCSGATENNSHPLDGSVVNQGARNLSNWPSARMHAASWGVGDRAGSAFIFGGARLKDPAAVPASISNRYYKGIFGDFWKWDGAQWTWMSSPSNVYGLQTNPPSITPLSPGILYEAKPWLDPSGNLWLYGGKGWRTISNSFAAALAGLFALKDPSSVWTVNGNSSALGDRTSPSFATNMHNNEIWMFGGRSSQDETFYYQDLWNGTWNGTDWSWAKMHSGAGDPASFPSRRSTTTLWVDNSNRVYLFGGNCIENSGTQVPCWDFWRWERNVNGTAGAWTLLFNKVPSLPPDRDSASSWTDNAGSLWLFGGQNSDIFSNGMLLSYRGLDDLWKWSENAWSKITPSNAGPSARQGSSSWKDSKGNLWVFGGGNLYAKDDGQGSDIYFNDLWKYNPGQNKWTQVPSTETYPPDYSHLKKGVGYHDGNRVFSGVGKSRSNKAILTTKGTLDDLNKLSEDFKLNVTTGTDGSAPSSGFASLARFINDNEKLGPCNSELNNCAFFRPNSKRVLIHASNSFDFSQRDPATMTDVMTTVGSSIGQTSGSRFEKSYLDKFFKKLDNNLSNDPAYMTIGFINQTLNDCEALVEANPSYYPAPSGERNYFCSYQKFINELKSDTSNSLAQYSNGFDFRVADYSQALEPFGRIIENLSTSVIDIAEFQLEDLPDFSFSVVINVVHADGSMITVPPEFYTIEGKTLKITNPGFGQMVSLTDKLKVTYVQKTTAS